jgi:hypothetical protein
MPSQLKIRSSRANGALSRGPKTAAGKLRAAGNSATHGLYSDRLILKSESQAEFDALLQQFLDDLRPQTQSESQAIKAFVVALWQYRRVIALETELLNQALRAIPKSIQDPDDQTVAAWTLACASPNFRSLGRVETRCVTSLLRATRRVFALFVTRKQPEIQSAAQNPNNEILTASPSIVKSTTCQKNETQKQPPTNPAKTPFLHPKNTLPHRHQHRKNQNPRCLERSWGGQSWPQPASAGFLFTAPNFHDLWPPGQTPSNAHTQAHQPARCLPLAKNRKMKHSGAVTPPRFLFRESRCRASFVVR